MDNIVNLFTQEHGIYQDQFKLKVIFLFIFIIVFFTKFLGGNYMGMIIVTTFSLTIINLYIKLNDNQKDDNNKNLIFKLDSLQNKVYDYIQYKIDLASSASNKLNNKDKEKLFAKNKLDSLYIDANLIVFLYSIIKLYDYNPPEFYLLLKGTNNILKLKKEIEQFYKANNNYPENIHEMLQIAIQLKANCLNNLQNNIYKVPKINNMYKYIDNSLITYNKLITNNIKEMHLYHQDYIRINGVNSRTQFIDINTSKAYNLEFNHPIIPSKSNTHKLIDLYI
jgi:hypothetical protein